jgi:hypothetical protein
MGVSNRRLRVVLIAAMMVVACDTEQTPTVGQTVVVDADIEGVPIPPQADLVAPDTVDGELVSRAYEVRGSTPEEVLSFYTDNLGTDWAPVVGPGPVGFGSDVEAGSDRKQYLGGWTTGERDLLVTTGPRQEGDSQVVILNLLVGPSGTDILDVEAVTP